MGPNDKTDHKDRNRGNSPSRTTDEPPYYDGGEDTQDVDFDPNEGDSGVWSSDD